MRTGVKFIGLGLALAIASCSTQDHTVGHSTPTAHLCSGTASGQLTFGMLALPPPSRVFPGMHVMWENGDSFVYVDEACTYWVLPPGDAWAETRTGILTSPQRLALEARLSSSSWGVWSGEHIPRDGIFDADLMAIMPGMKLDSVILCFGGCGGAPIPTGLQTAAAEIRPIAAELWAIGVAVTGGVRYQVVREETDPLPVDYLAWPLALSASEIAISEADAARVPWGQGRSATGTDAASLRALRQQYRSTTTPELVPQIPVKDANGDRYKVFLRDSLPQEDVAGLVRPL